MNQQFFIDRITAWANRAANEITYATGANKNAWQGQYEVLRSCAAAAASGSNAIANLETFRNNIIMDRKTTITEWNHTGAEDDAAMLTGKTQGYDLILSLLKEAGAAWS